MRNSRTRNIRRQAVRRRTIAIESLGSRIALSASGIGEFMLETNGPPRDHELQVEHVRSLNAGGEFNTWRQSAWPGANGRFDGIGFRQQHIVVTTSVGDRPAMGGNWGDDGIANRFTAARVVPASVQVSGTNLVLPGLLVSRGDTLSLLIAAPPSYGLQVGLPFAGLGDSREPLFDRNGVAKPIIDLSMQHASVSGEANRDGDHSSMTVGASTGPTGGPATPPRTGDTQSFVSTTLPPHASDARLSGTWVAELETEVHGDMETTPAQAVPPAGQWAISRADLDEGLIELENPLGPRRKGRKLPGESPVDESQTDDPWVELQALADRVWSAWNDAWQEYGRDGQLEPESVDAAKVAQGSTAGFDADVLEGLVEVVIEGSAVTQDGPQLAAEQIAEEHAPVRIDAGVAVYQEFEVATAADAAAQATARSSVPKAEEDERAEVDKPAEERPISAAVVGAGLIIAVPLSVRRRRQDEDSHELPQLRRT